MAQNAVPPFPPAPKVLVVKLRQLGDVLLATPVFRALREHFPDAHLAACVPGGAEVMLQGNPHINEVLSFSRGQSSTGKSSRWLRELAFLRQVRRAGFDLVLDLTTNDRAAVIARISGAKVRAGFVSRKGFVGRNRLYTHLATPKYTEHTVLQNLELLRALGLDWRDASLEFRVSDQDREFVGSLIKTSRPVVHIHPYSRIEKKCWPDEFMARLIDHVAGLGLTPVVTGSSDPAELVRIARLLSMTRARCVNLGGRLTLGQLGALSAQAKLFVGVDTGPMHIAGAVGAPVVALFGPSSETLWRPWCKHHLVVSRDLPCRLPCKNKHGCTTIECLREMTPEMVLPQVNVFLRQIS